jgi:hypothetical protein
MMKHQIASLVLIVSLVIFAGAGCQSSQSSTVDTDIQPASEQEASQQKQADPAAKEAPQPAETVDSGQAPKIIMTKDVHDFGKIGPATSQRLFQTDSH